MQPDQLEHCLHRHTWPDECADLHEKKQCILEYLTGLIQEGEISPQVHDSENLVNNFMYSMMDLLLN
eukprot:6583255-Prorocentrum_lima.AAC.1